MDAASGVRQEFLGPKDVSRPFAMLRLLLLLVVFLVAGGTLADPLPAYVSQVAPDYKIMTLADVEFGLPCQYFTDLGGRYISTALPVTVPAGHFYDVLGLQFDFIVGRRPASQSSIMLFDWDGESTLAAASAATVLHWQMDCDGRPCDVPQPPINPTRIYKDVEYPWGWLYKIDFILPPGAPFTVAAPSLEEPFTIWFNLSIAFPSYDINSGYRYKIMLPVRGGGSGSAARFALQDPFNLLGHNWTLWTPASDAIRTTLLGLVPPSPVFGHRVAAYVRPYDTIVSSPSSTGNNDTTAATAESPSSSGEAVAPTPMVLETWHIVMIAAGSVLVFAIIVLLVVIGAIALRRKYRRTRRNGKDATDMTSAFFFPADGTYNPLDDQTSSGQELEVSSVILSADDEGEWHRPPTRISTSDVQWQDDQRGKIQNVRDSIGLASRSSLQDSTPPLPRTATDDDPAYQRDGLKVMTPTAPPPPPTDTPPQPPKTPGMEEI